MRFTLRATPEVILLTVFLALSLLGLIFIEGLVASPKLLLGRSLSAIAPSLFPTIIFGLLALLCIIQLFLLNRKDSHENEGGLTYREWLRGSIFFGIMILYALTMQPLGFLISSAIAITLISWQLGNRSILQTLCLSLVPPVLLYLAATRLLAVSLPELNVIELAYARLLGG